MLGRVNAISGGSGIDRIKKVGTAGASRPALIVLTSVIGNCLTFERGE